MRRFVGEKGEHGRLVATATRDGKGSARVIAADLSPVKFLGLAQGSSAMGSADDTDVLHRGNRVRDPRPNFCLRR